MDLSHNSVFWILSGEHKGLYRVIFDFPFREKVVVARIGEPPSMMDPASANDSDAPAKPTPAANKRKHKSRPLVGNPIWLPRPDLEYLHARQELRFGEIKLPSLYYESIEPHTEDATEPQKARYEANKARFDRRVASMQPFLNLDRLSECLSENGPLAELMALVTKPPIKKTSAHQGDDKEQSRKRSSRKLLIIGKENKRSCIGTPNKDAKHMLVSRGLAYKCWSLLCLYGFHESSLKIRFDRCGAPGMLRPCDPGGRKKAGAKTEKQRQAIQRGIADPPPEQPGTSTEWRVLVMQADNSIPNPKPHWKRRFRMIVGHAFVREFKDDHGTLIAVKPKQGTYPNNTQIKHIITVETPKLILLRQKTTSGHFDRSKRGLPGKSWEGVTGPGHTWAIDSTVGDTYLRSSIKRSWVIGRPIVYTIVDVWSTAVVGFYVCLTGPSWDMAKISLFCAGANPGLTASLWGYPLFSTLEPFPTLPYVLMCDRGEYLSRAARQTGMKLRFIESYAPPYRPDLKGVVEVMHRISKDEQFEFVPGSIDARRVEMERRKFDPCDAIFTLREYVAFLYGLYNHYNLTADRSHRVDAHMQADGVYPSPAGLWRWGHGVGLGRRRSVSEAQLVTDLLPSGKMILTASGVNFARSLYKPPGDKHLEWATLARNFNRSHGICHYFPGTASQIWTAHNAQKGILNLSLSDYSTASAESTFDEIADVYKYDLQNRAKREHQATMHGLDWLQRSRDQIEQAKALTEEALADDSTPIPTLTAARALEATLPASAAAQPIASPIASGSTSSTDYIAMMDAILNSDTENA